MAALQAGMLVKMLELIDDSEVKVAGHHRSVLLRIIAIVPALSGGDGDADEGCQLWRPNLGFHLRVSDASHSLYVTVPSYDEETCDLVLNGDLQLGQFVYADRLENGSPYPRLVGMKSVPVQKLQSNEELQISASMVEEIPQKSPIRTIDSRAGESSVRSKIIDDDGGGGGDGNKDARDCNITTKSRERRKSYTGNNIVSKWEISANSGDTQIRSSVGGQKLSIHGSATVKGGLSNLLFSPCSKKRVLPSENRYQNSNKKGGLISSENQGSDQLWENFPGNATDNKNSDVNLLATRSISKPLGLKLSDHQHEKLAFPADSLQNSSLKKTSGNIDTNRLSRPVLKVRSSYNNCINDIVGNTSDQRGNVNHIHHLTHPPRSKAFLFEKTPIKGAQLSRRFSSINEGRPVHHQLSDAKKPNSTMVHNNCNVNSSRKLNLPAIPATRDQNVSVTKERSNARAPSPNRLSSAESHKNSSTKTNSNNHIMMRKSCTVIDRNASTSCNSSITNTTTLFRDRQYVRSSTTTTTIATVSARRNPRIDSSSSSSVIRSSRKGWDFRPSDCLVPQRSTDMASSRFSSAPRSSRINQLATPLAGSGRSKTQVNAENVRTNQAISKSSQIALSSVGRNQRSIGEDRRSSNIHAKKAAHANEIFNPVTAFASAPSSLMHQKRIPTSFNNKPTVTIHDKRWTDGSVSWDPISPSLAGLAKEIASFRKTASSAAAQALQEASAAEIVLRNVSIFAELCSQSRPESPRKAMEKYFNFHCSLQLATTMSNELAKSCQKNNLFSDTSSDDHSLAIEERRNTAPCSRERLRCAASWVSAALATDLAHVNEHADELGVENIRPPERDHSMKGSKVTGDSIKASEVKGSIKASERGLNKFSASEASKKPNVFTSKTSSLSPGKPLLRPTSPMSQRRMSNTPVNCNKMRVKSHGNNRLRSSCSSGEIINSGNILSRKDAFGIVSNLFAQPSSSSLDISTESGLLSKCTNTEQERVLMQLEDTIKAESIVQLARQLQAESQKWFFNYMEEALDCGFKFLDTGSIIKESKPHNNAAEIGISDNGALASVLPHLKQLNDWIGKLDYGTLDAKMLEVLSRLKKKIRHFLLQHIGTIDSALP